MHPEFLLYPTYEHQNGGLIKDEYQGDLQQTLDENDVPGLISLGHWCQVTDKFQVSEQDLLDNITPYHIWTSDYANQRLHWRPKQPVTIALLRVYELQQPQALPVLDEYGGCKSWVELGQDVPLSVMTPVLSDQAYEEKAEMLRQVLGGAPLAV